MSAICDAPLGRARARTYTPRNGPKGVSSMTCCVIHAHRSRTCCDDWKVVKSLRASVCECVRVEWFGHRCVFGVQRRLKEEASDVVSGACALRPQRTVSVRRADGDMPGRNVCLRKVRPMRRALHTEQDSRWWGMMCNRQIVVSRRHGW
jgi:hypothetical protein